MIQQDIVVLSEYRLPAPTQQETIQQLVEYPTPTQQQGVGYSATEQEAVFQTPFSSPFAFPPSLYAFTQNYVVISSPYVLPA
ncbi:hypothetical protein TNCT_615811 [Trichonephila clavata]|uniref:Uncharacterized protein n=1 Tax=Trichonephila clavata TaxID=2740835 RepID=A0A8X6EWR4_TRICU|nr:hypothetical protein TNCT_615811 [Trichonephila clavata]